MSDKPRTVKEDKIALSDYLRNSSTKYREAKVTQARRSLSARYAETLPVQMYWQKDYESENTGLKAEKTQEWMVQRFYLAQLGVYAAERVRNVYTLILWPILGLLTLALWLIQPQVNGWFESPLPTLILSGIGVTVLLTGLLLWTGLFAASYRLFLPKVLIDKDTREVIEKLITRCCVRLLPANTPTDLADRFRSLVTDSEGDSVVGQILPQDMEDPYFAGELQAAHWFLLFGSGVFCLACSGYGMAALITWSVLMLILIRLPTPLQERATLAASASAESATEYLKDAAGRGYFRQQEKALQDQIENAINDQSPFIDLGISTGIFYERRDTLAPSESGMNFG